MNEQDDTPSQQPTGAKRDAIDINDFVFAATGARVRRLTLPDRVAEMHSHVHRRARGAAAGRR